MTWAIDCITEITPPASNGGKAIVIAIDAWSKWTMCRVINPLDSREVAQFFYEDIICTFGVPFTVRCDSGTEFQGDFISLCKQYNV